MSFTLTHFLRASAHLTAPSGCYDVGAGGATEARPRKSRPIVWRGTSCIRRFLITGHGRSRPTAPAAPRSARWLPSGRPLWLDVASPLLRMLQPMAVPASVVLVQTIRPAWKDWCAVATAARRRAIVASRVRVPVTPAQHPVQWVRLAPIAVRGSAPAQGRARRSTTVKRGAIAASPIRPPAHRV